MTTRFMNCITDVGKIFVCTAHGYERTIQRIKSERSIGQPIVGFEHSVPASWIEHGYVEEVPMKERIIA